LTLLHSLPQILTDNARRRNSLNDPSALGIEARAALAGIRVLAIAQPVSGGLADIEFAVEIVGAAADIAVDGGRTPRAAA
jgi:hypothetical protein